MYGLLLLLEVVMGDWLDMVSALGCWMNPPDRVDSVRVGVRAREPMETHTQFANSSIVVITC